MNDDEFQIFLDAISDCFITKDFSEWEDRIRLPFTMVTKLDPVVLHTREALRQNFEGYLQACSILKVDTIIRRPVNCEDCKDGTWIGTYETELLSHGARAIPTYTSSVLLHKTGHGWKMSSILNARGHRNWTGRIC